MVFLTSTPRMHKYIIAILFFLNTIPVFSQTRENNMFVDFSWEGECQNTLITFQGTHTFPNPPYTYYWDFGDGSGWDNVVNTAYTYSSPGTYNVTFTITDASMVDESVTHQVEILPSPVSSFTFMINSDTVDFTNTSILADIYYWDFDDGDTSLQQNPQHVFAGGDYTVCLEVENLNGCKNTFCDSISVLPDGIMEEEQNLISIFPNPADEFMLIHFSETSEKFIELTDYSGKTILKRRTIENKSEIISTSAIANGIYFLSIIYQDTFHTKKICILHH